MHVFDPGAVAGTTRGGIDNVDFVDGLPGLVFHPKPTIVSHGAPVLVSGWTVDPATAAAPAAVVVLLDRVRQLHVTTGIARGDIMADHGTDEFVGFQLAVDTTDLGSGSHELRVYALCADGLWYESAAAGFRVFHDVVPVKETLSRPLRMSLDGRIDLTIGKHLRPGAPIRANHWIQIQGWTYDSVTGTGAARIAAVDAAGRMWSGPSDVERPDAGVAMQSAKSQLGFEIVVPPAVFGRGHHDLRIIGFDERGRRYTNALDVPLDIIAEENRFPLTARQSSTSGPVGARLRVIEHAFDRGAAEVASDDDVLLATHALPSGTIAAPRGSEIRIEGWAMDEHGVAADDIYLELCPTWAKVPPLRLATFCGWTQAPFDEPLAGGTAGSYFTVSLDADELRGGSHALALAIVRPDRCSFSRVPLATLTIV